MYCIDKGECKNKLKMILEAAEVAGRQEKGWSGYSSSLHRPQLSCLIARPQHRPQTGAAVGQRPIPFIQHSYKRIYCLWNNKFLKVIHFNFFIILLLYTQEIYFFGISNLVISPNAWNFKLMQPPTALCVLKWFSTIRK